MPGLELSGLIFIDRAHGIDSSWLESFGDSSVCLSELAGIKLRFGLGIERDLHFEAKYPLSVYADARRIDA
jgi:hypothetical protein